MGNRWCMFLSMENDKKLTEKYISHVVYHLHSAFKEKTIVSHEHPYLLSRIALGTFKITVEIEFRPWT